MVDIVSPGDEKQARRCVLEGLRQSLWKDATLFIAIKYLSPGSLCDIRPDNQFIFSHHYKISRVSLDRVCTPCYEVSVSRLAAKVYKIN